MRIFILIFTFPLLFSCVSYHDQHKQSYHTPYTAYNIYNSPLRVRPLNHNDFYMIHHHPRDYFQTQGIASIDYFSQMIIHNFFRNLTR